MLFVSFRSDLSMTFSVSDHLYQSHIEKIEKFRTQICVVLYIIVCTLCCAVFVLCTLCCTMWSLWCVAPCDLLHHVVCSYTVLYHLYCQPCLLVLLPSCIPSLVSYLVFTASFSMTFAMTCSLRDVK